MSDTVDEVPDNPSEQDAADELTQLKAENEGLRGRARRRAAIRRWVAVALVVLTSLSVVVGTVAVWAHETVFDTDSFMETVEPALEDPALYVALADFVTEETLTALDVETRVTDALTRLDEYLSETLLDALEIGDRGRAILDRFDRPSLAALAPPIATALETRVTEIIDGFITSDEFQERLPDIVRRAHTAAVALIRGNLEELPNVSVEEGEVRLNLIPIMAEILNRVADQIRGFGPDITLPDVISDRVDEARQQLAEALRAELPEDFGQVTVMSEESLTYVQDGVQRLDRWVWGLILLTLVLAVVTIAVSPNRRRTTIQLAIGVVVGLIVGAVLLRRLQAAILDAITSPDGTEAVRSLLAEVLASLRSGALIVGIVAVVIGVVAYLAGRPAWLTNLSQRGQRLIAPGPAGSELDRWMSGHHDMLRIVGVGAAVVAVFLTGIELLPVLLIGGALALYLWAISEARRRISALPPAADSPAHEEMETT